MKRSPRIPAGLVALLVVALPIGVACLPERETLEQRFERRMREIADRSKAENERIWSAIADMERAYKERLCHPKK